MAGKRFPEEFNHRDNIKKEDILLVNNSETDIDEYATIEEAFTLLDDKFNTKADKVSGAVDGNFASLDANGNLEDSGKKSADFVEVANIANNVTTEDEGKVLDARQGKVLNDAKINKNGTNSDIDVLHFDPDTVVALANVGDVRYSPESKTLEVKISNSCTIQIGQEMTARVKNGETSDILNGKVVYIDTALGSNPVAKLATTADQDIAQRTFAVATEDIATFGIVTTEGLVRDVDTDGMTEGSLIWLGTDGNFTTTEPTTPTPKVCIGMVLRESATEGVIYVHIRAIPRMAKLSDVFTTTLTGGDILRYNSTSGRFEQFNITTALEDKQDAITITADTSPVNTDEVLSLRGSSWLKTTWTNIKAFLKTYFDSLYVLITDLTTIQPAVQFLKRVTADGGTVVDKSLLAKVYTEFNQSLANTHCLYFPQIGIKERTSGINKYANKLYDLSANNNDAVQATEATQSFVGGYIAPNEFRCLKYLQGQTQTGEITIPTKSYLATDSWTLTMALKANRASGRILVGSTWRIQIEPAYISLQTGSVIIMSGVHSFAWGKTAIIEFQYSNGTALIKVNGIPLVTTPTSSAIDFNKIAYASATPFDGSIYYYHLENVRISEADSQKRYNFLRSLLPEIEGINIGNQFWITSNIEQTVAGNGEVIPEVQLATSGAELISGGNFESGLILTKSTDGNETSTWQLNTTNPISGTQDGRLVVSVVGTNATRPLLQTSLSGTIGKYYKLTFDYKVNSGTPIIAGIFNGVARVSEATTLTGSGSITRIILCAGVSILGSVYFNGTNLFDLQIDNFSIKEAGWADLTTPAWCYPDNDVAKGAVYGKLYNWYAIDLINKYAPQGYRVPTSADFTQLATALDGTTVAGGKMKKEGLTYWNSPNTGATNESGFSAIGVGYRQGSTGNFLSYNTGAYFFSQTVVNGINENSAGIVGSWLTSSSPKSGATLRYLRTSPVGENRRQIESGFFTTDIASVAKSINVPHGYVITQIRITTTTNVTSIEAKLFNTAGSAVATLITGKACNATSIVFDVAVDQPTQPTDFTVKTTAVGNSTAGVIGMNITVICEKIQI